MTARTSGTATTDFCSYDPGAVAVPALHQVLLGAVAPRPIALAASRDAAGRDNLSPFSFFNCFSANPPVLILSPSRSGRDAARKDTLLNVLATREVTISVVTHALAEQANLASCAYPHGTDEFVKAGLTKLPSVKVAPPGVAESPAILECSLREHVSLGDDKAAGQLLVVTVVHVRVRHEVLDGNGRIDPFKMDQVARLGGEWYTRARSGLFELPKPPPTGVGVGFDSLPPSVRHSPWLTGSDLARLALVEQIPKVDHSVRRALGVDRLSGEALHRACREQLELGNVATAWQVALLIAEGEAR